MNLTELTNALKTINDRDEFDKFISQNVISLTDLFYSFFTTDILVLDLDNFYFGQVTTSPVFQDFLQNKTHTSEFDAFLFLLAALGEKLAENGITSVGDHVRGILPESALKYRLQALSKIHNIDNVKVDYISKFPEVLELLAKSENFDEGGTGQIIDFLIYYYQKAIAKFQELNLSSEIEIFSKLFVETSSISKYHFLNHETIKELLAGRYAHELQIEDVVPGIQYPSDIIESIFKNEINRKVFALPGTDNISEPMGYDSLKIRGEMLNYGKTDFDTPFNSEVTAEIKVLFYCYYNMKKHFFTSLVVFKKLWTSIKDVFLNAKYKPVFIDLGCGPLTSGLAIGDLFKAETGENINFTYVGIDISKEMIKQAKLFSKNNLFNQDNSFYFYANWNRIPSSVLLKAAGSNNPFFINASYLFASTSVDEKDLASFTTKLATKFKNVHFIFQNPDRSDRNTKWENFKTFIKYKKIEGRVEKVLYKTAKTALREPTSEDVYFEILTLLPQ